ncbi:MAG: TRAP transporter substrate-binding protein [Rhodospirillaceae bacterium]
MRKLMIAGALTAALVASMNLQSSAVQAQSVTLKLHVFVPPPANPFKTFLAPWAKKVEKDSGGKLKIQLYPSMQLGGKPTQLVDQVKDGIVDIAWTLPGYTAGRFPKLEVFELPFVHTSPLATTLAIQDFYDKHLKEEFKDYHVLLLHCHAGSLFQTKKPIRKFTDVRGLKIRTATRAGGWYLKSIGAVPIGAPLPAIPQMLSKGVIEGALLPFEIAPAIKMQQLVSNFSVLEGSQPRMNTSTFSFLMNKKSYAKLPADLKKVIDRNSGRALAALAGNNWANIENPARGVMASKKKNKFHTIPAAEVEKFKAAAKPAIDRWVKQMKEKGIDGDALLKDARAMIAKYSK